MDFCQHYEQHFIRQGRNSIHARHYITGLMGAQRKKNIETIENDVAGSDYRGKPSRIPPAIVPEEGLRLPVQLIRFHFEDREGKKQRMVLATTLLDDGKYDGQDLAAIYAQRWDIELRLRDVKTTLELEHLRVKTPLNARKTLRMA